MSKAQQLPKLYLRGSLTSVTIPSLTTEERAHADELSQRIYNHPKLRDSREMVSKKLSETIGGEYKDRQAADQETLITIWRGVVHLFYHKDYEFVCDHCGSSTYYTKNNKVDKINQIGHKCKACNCVYVVKAGDTGLEEGTFINFDEFQASYEYLTDDDDQPISRSPVRAIPGKKKYDDPQRIIDSEEEMCKYFTRFLRSSVSQILNENKIITHNTHLKEIVGRADEILVEELLSVLVKTQTKHTFDIRTQPEAGWYTIRTLLLQTPPEVSISLAEVLEKAYLYNIRIECGTGAVMVKVTETAPMIKAKVSKPEFVMLADAQTDEDNVSLIDQIGGNMDHEDHVALITMKDLVTRVREALPKDDCIDIFDIYYQKGSTWEMFKAQYGDGPAKICNIKDFLGISRKKVQEAKSTIELKCLQMGFTPV